MSNERNKPRLPADAFPGVQPSRTKHSHKEVSVRRVVLRLPGLSKAGDALLFLRSRRGTRGPGGSQAPFDLTILW